MLPLPTALAAPSPLDEVVWTALCGPHAALAMAEGDDARRYPPDVAPFGAVRPPAPGSPAQLAALLAHAKTVAIVSPAEAPMFDDIEPITRLGVDQMLLVDPAALASVPTIEALPLGPVDVPDMLALVQATRPGPFGPGTIRLGLYLGLRSDGKLLAMAGERLKVPGFTEISAVCVAPECRGRGYAAALIKALATAIQAHGETPFLHVATDNTSAIALYQRLGFRLRRRFSLRVFGRTG